MSKSSKKTQLKLHQSQVSRLLARLRETHRLSQSLHDEADRRAFLVKWETVEKTRSSLEEEVLAAEGLCLELHAAEDIDLDLSILDEGERGPSSPVSEPSPQTASSPPPHQQQPFPPRPLSGQSARLSHSPLAPAGPYPQPPHGVHPYKTPPHMPPYSQAGQQYPPRPGPQGMQYGPTPAQYPQPQPNNIPGVPGPYPGRPVSNHAPHSQYSGYQAWGGPQGAPPTTLNQTPLPSIMSGPSNHMPPNGKGNAQPQPTPPPNQPSATPTGPRPHTPPHYLKQHLHNKMGFTGPGPGMPPSPGPPQNYPAPGMGPPGGMHHHMGSQSPMGPPPPSGMPHHPGMGPPPPQNMGPPVPPSTPDSHIGHETTAPVTPTPPVAPGPGSAPATTAGGMPPPSSTPNSHSVPPVEDAVTPHDNGITTTAVGRNFRQPGQRHVHRGVGC